MKFHFLRSERRALLTAETDRWDGRLAESREREVTVKKTWRGSMNEGDGKKTGGVENCGREKGSKTRPIRPTMPPHV